jgi:putative ABC transport system ATP-binding protein
LKLQTGDFAILIGVNGAGKSTLLNLICGVWPCDSGKIILENKDITRYPEHKRAQYVARVFQNPMHGLVLPMSIEENIAMALSGKQGISLHKGITAEKQRIIQNILRSVGLGLENSLSLPVGSLSGGQRQALALLMATVRQPSLLLLDEFTSGLDPQTVTRILGLTEKVIKENSFTTIMVTHNIEHALQYGNRLLMMDSGQIVLDIASDEKKALTKTDLIAQFKNQPGTILTNQL